MKIEVVKKHFAELTELDEAIEKGCPVNYQPPFYFIKSGNVISRFEFLTRIDHLNKLGKRKYFDMNFELACEFDTFNDALIVARKFKLNDVDNFQHFYIIGYQEAIVLKMYIQERRDAWGLTE